MYFPFSCIQASLIYYLLIILTYLDTKEPFRSAPSRANNQFPLRFYLQTSWNIKDNLDILQSSGENDKLYYKLGWGQKLDE